MFDMLKLKVSTKFMKGFVGKFVSKKIYEKTGCKATVEFSDIVIDTVNGDVIIHIDADAKINRTEFERFLETLN